MDQENNHDIDVSVDTSYIEAQSDEGESRFVESPGILYSHRL